VSQPAAVAAFIERAAKELAHAPNKLRIISMAGDWAAFRRRAGTAARKLRQADRRSIGLAFALHPLLTGDLTLAG